MNQDRLSKVILFPHISEKATRATELNNQYVFHVLSSATKVEIKDAAEMLLKAKVQSVNVVNIPPKAKMFKGRKGFHKAWKKAYITFASDQKLAAIEVVR